MVIKKELKKINFKLFIDRYEKTNNTILYELKNYKINNILRQKIKFNRLVAKKKQITQFITIQNNNSYINKFFYNN
jgi:hypothetical protein